MTNIFDYVKKYGDFSFLEKDFNDLDNLVFSYLTYLNYTKTKVGDNIHTLEEIANEYLSINNYKKISKKDFSQVGAYKLLKIIKSKKRYKDIILTNYKCKVNKEMQFSAITFNINKYLKCIYFEGTDVLISGWKEDFLLASTFLIPSQKEAIKYVNENIKVKDRRVIIGGHSKGGNLALVAGMYLKGYKRFKLKKIYNNDGPSLLKREFKSFKYKRIRKKLIHIVPEYSIIGMLLYSDRYKVIKSTKKNILAHDLSTWITNDDKLVSSHLSEKSKKLRKNILIWINSHNEEEIKRLTYVLFKIMEDENIDDTIKLMKLKNIIKVSHKFIKLDKETKDLLLELIIYTFDKYKEKGDNGVYGKDNRNRYFK